MTLGSWLRRLERQAASAGHSAEACESCGRPDPRGPQVLIVNASEWGEGWACPSCDRHLDRTGRPLGRHGQVIVVHDADESLTLEDDREGSGQDL